MSSNILLLGFVSLFTDISSEMIVAVFPLYVIGIGGTPISLGIINGITQATANIVKGLSGWLSDKLKKRKLFIISGYSLSNICKPLIGVVSNWGAVLGLKFGDRIVKGLRTSPRDALIGYYAEESDQKNTGRAFGIHRSMDTTGAVIGPILASIFIIFGISFGNIILYSAIPGVISIIFLIFVKDFKQPNCQGHSNPVSKPKIGQNTQSQRLSKDFLKGVFVLGIMQFASVATLLQGNCLIKLVESA